MTGTDSEFRPRAIINHNALRHNLAKVRAMAPNSRIWAVIKADAYGHGAIEVARTLQADGLAVARLAEARVLRNAGENRPILIMGGVYSSTELTTAAALNCEIAVHNPIQAQMLMQSPQINPIRVWIKINTGMNRLGLSIEDAGYWLTRLTSDTYGRPGLMTHLACADELKNPATLLQYQRLKSIPGANTCNCSIDNSAGILGWKECKSDWVRPGIMLYGISPFADETGEQRGLIPVMTLCAPLIAIHKYQPGDLIGYGGSYICREAMTVGVIGIGYGDGYPRHAPTGTPVLLHGVRVPIVGRVSMDMITVDLSAVPDADLGDSAVLWGDGLPAEEIAAMAGTIAYQLVTDVTNRVLRIHIDRAE